MRSLKLLAISTAILLLGFSQATGAPKLKKPVGLKFGLCLPAKAAPYHGVFVPWAKEIEQRTNGMVKTEFYLSSTLIKPRDAYRGVVKGIADVGYIRHSTTPGRFPLISVVELPFMAPSSEVGARVLNELYGKFPEMQAEHKDVHLLALGCGVPIELHTVKKPARTLEHIKGMKIATAKSGAVALEGAGAVPVVMITPDFYGALEKGVVDGLAIPYGALGGWKLYEVTNYHTNAHMGVATFWVAMNKDTWNRLPTDIQKIITEVSDKIPTTFSSAITDEMNRTVGKVKKLGHEIIALSPGEMARWRATAKPEWDKWAKAMEAKGLPGRAVLDEAVRLVDKYR